MKSHGRIRSLDGLRGAAALVVVFHHVLLTWRPWAVSYTTGGSWWTYTPLHTLLDGTAAVYVFFVLSGFVLTWRSTDDWRAYYAQRLPRLYLPVWASVAIAYALAEIVKHPHGTWWLDIHQHSTDGHTVVHELLLLPGVTTLNGPLWSLAWEVLFSLLLPVYILVSKRLSQFPVLQVAALIAVTMFGQRADHSVLIYMPMFGIGVIMALHGREWRHHSWRGATIALAAASVFWAVSGLKPAHFDLVLALALGLQVAAATWLVNAAWKWQPLVERLESRPLQWLGSRSFSLYLVHERIVVSLADVLHNFVVRAVVSIAVSLLATEVFYRLLEQPAHRASQVLGRRFRRAPAPAPVTAPLAEAVS